MSADAGESIGLPGETFGTVHLDGHDGDVEEPEADVEDAGSNLDASIFAAQLAAQKLQNELRKKIETLFK